MKAPPKLIQERVDWHQQGFSREMFSMSEEDVLAVCADLIKGGEFTPESVQAEKLESAFCLLLKKNNKKVYELIDQLPPGYYSRMIVAMAFRKAEYGSVGDHVAISGFMAAV